VQQPHYAAAYRAPALQQQRSGLPHQYSGLPHQSSGVGLQHQVSGGGATYPLGSSQQYGANRQSSGQLHTGERQSLNDVPPVSPQGYRPKPKQGQAYYM
jgi:hypothetical protein